MLLFVAAPAGAAPAFTLTPFEFVGTAEQCGGAAGTDTVTAEWVDDTGNQEPSIKLEKLGATTNCAAAGVDIGTSIEGQPISALTELNYDYKNDGHCGAGAPRFNVETSEGTLFLGCAAAPKTETSDPDWTHIEYDVTALATAFSDAGINAAATITDIYIIFDEGSDTPTGGSIQFAGTVFIDNISVNEAVIGSPTSPSTKDQCKKNGWKNFDGMFKNQGDCVSYVTTGGRNLGNNPTF